MSKKLLRQICGTAAIAGASILTTANTATAFNHSIWSTSKPNQTAKDCKRPKKTRDGLWIEVSCRSRQWPH
jgi:hypothetical protein